MECYDVTYPLPIWKELQKKDVKLFVELFTFDREEVAPEIGSGVDVLAVE